jgi:uncharacterized membrane protein YtjA (UPF0391 family)
MFNAALSFFLIAILAFIFGAYGIAGISVDIGKIILSIFLGLSIIAFFTSFISKKQKKT